MNIIELKEEQLKNFTVISNASWESIVYLYNNKVYKIFKTNECAKYTNKQLNNKLQKLLLLNQIDLDIRFVKPLDLVFINNEFKGYTMDFISYITLDNFYFKSKKKKIEKLKQIREIIKIAHENDIILCDLNENNFLFYNNIARACDLDNWKIHNLNPDVINENIAGEYLKYQPLDQNLDLFLFNVLAISLITKISQNFILSPLIMEKTEFSKNAEYKKFYLNLINFRNEKYKNEDILELIDKKKKFCLHKKNS